jgi:hypothetical protein
MINFKSLTSHKSRYIHNISISTKIVINRFKEALLVFRLPTSLNPTSVGTVSLWVRPHEQKLCGILYKANSNAYTTLEYAISYGSDGNDGKVSLVIWGAASANVVTAPSPIPLNTWTNITGVWDGSKLRIYINGLEANSANQTINPYDGDNDIKIGADLNLGTDPANWRYFNGTIDDIHIYNYALTASQVKQEYNQGSAVGFGPAEGNP